MTVRASSSTIGKYRADNRMKVPTQDLGRLSKRNYDWGAKSWSRKELFEFRSLNIQKPEWNSRIIIQEGRGPSWDPLITLPSTICVPYLPLILPHMHICLKTNKPLILLANSYLFLYQENSNSFQFMRLNYLKRRQKFLERQRKFNIHFERQ